MDDLFCRKQEQLRKQMSTAKAKGVLEKVAYHWGVSLETVEQEIEKAIREAQNQSKNARILGQDILPGGISYAGGAAFVFGRKCAAPKPRAILRNGSE